MRIIIVGCGKVGYTLAEELSAEKHDVTIIDTNDTVLRKVADTLDVLCIKGNGASIKLLREAGALKTDILIAATGHDELNMLCCFSAKRLGVQCTVARIRDQEYVQDIGEFKEQLDIDMVVNPEFSTAAFISRLLRFPEALDIETFFRGRIELIGFKVNEDDGITGAPLYTVKKKMGNISVLFCAVERNGETSIPHGSFVLEPGDKVYVIGSILNVNKFFRYIGRSTQKVKDTFIIGGGRIASYLSGLLSETNISVKIAEIDPVKCEALAEALPKALIVNGDGTDQEFLESEELSRSSSFVSLTGRDEDNIIMALHAKQLGIQRVIAKANSQNYYDMIENLGLDCSVSPKVITADAILRMVRAMQNSHGSHMESLYRIADGDAEAMVFTVGETTKNQNIPLKDLRLKKGILVAVISRANRLIIPEGGDSLQTGDKIILISRGLPILDINDIFVD